jgi:anion-transporting  ArsA/GET3 family ATPase
LSLVSRQYSIGSYRFDLLFEDFKDSYKQDIYLMFEQFLAKGLDIKFDREVMAELFSMAPPGLDEIMAINRIMELKQKNEFDVIIIDSSPTGHLLRFLELPGLVRQWLKTLFNLLTLIWYCRTLTVRSVPSGKKVKKFILKRYGENLQIYISGRSPCSPMRFMGNPIWKNL